MGRVPGRPRPLPGGAGSKREISASSPSHYHDNAEGRNQEMKAVVFHQHGPLDNLRYEEVPDARPGATEILIRVRAVALNGFDPMVLRGIPGLKTPLPMTPGADIAGEIIELGAEVERGRW